MSFLETFDLSITTLSSVHVGCGEDYEPTNYVINNQRLYEFDPVALMRQLSQTERDEFSRKVEQGLREIQSFFYRHKDKIAEIGRYGADVNTIAQAFYDNRVGRVVQREQGGQNVLNKLEIARTAFNPLSGLPILPGSSVKGAIRTALLKALRANNYPVTTRGRQERDIKRDAIQMNKKLNEETLGGFSTDLLRLLKISDAIFRPKIKVRDREGNIREQVRRPRICFQVNRKKHPNQFQAGGNINTLLECLPGNLINVFAASGVIENKAKHGVETPDRQIDFAWIAKVCNDFYLERLQAECKVLRAQRYALPWVESVENRLSENGAHGKAIAAGQGFLLRVGRHSGAESVTVDAPRTIKIMKGRGQNPDWSQEATTLWLAAESKDQTEGLQPFGWIFVQRKG
ncbi:type III-A CRISPR-associated RAMP protein Csm5 [Betaproteobacteria bacterium]|nr:type III-A CRISPR-associated RAMP protein Csm5 [Betaproteobacteria bacterium]GHU23756.1 type III-A CRISPR-associated RAMP protein Csm5 [Betaproteobacteria bacterium]GHU29126.1 type III-A CRISPR-associated RAMP protein Csm5 [Betaproteobacteria bacterium]